MTDRPRHIVLDGPTRSVKSDLIARLLEATERSVHGFITRRLDADETGFHPIYIHPAGCAVLKHSPDNLIGTCDSKVHHVNTRVFEELGVRYLDVPSQGIVVMDELGFMEAGAKAFISRVFTLLEGDIPVIASTKARTDIPFLCGVRSHPNCRVYAVTPENLEDLYAMLLPVVRSR